MNKSIMMGRVVNEPDLRYTQTENGELIVAQLSRHKFNLFIMN